MSATTSVALTEVEVVRFHDDGYLGPIELCTPEEMKPLRDRIDREVLSTEGLCKDDPGQSRHLDGNYWPIEPSVNISAWLAIDESTIENSCVQLIPGTHRRIVPHVKATEGMAFREMADPAAYDVSKLINMELKPGQFFLFNE